MIFLFENFAESRLVERLPHTREYIVLPPEDAAKWPKPATAEQRASVVLYDGIQDPEIVWITSNPGTGVVTVERGREETTARDWAPGTVAINSPTKTSINYLASGGGDSWHRELVDMVNEAYARIGEEYTLRLTSEYAFAQRLQYVEAGFGDAEASVRVLHQAYADIDSAWANYQVDVESSLNDARAKAGQAINTAVETNQATATLKQFVEAAVGDNAAAFSEQITAFANADAAQLTINTEMSTRVGESETRLTEEIELRSDQFTTQGLINETLSARIGDNTALIEEESRVRADETSAIAIRTTNIESEVLAGRGGQSTLAARINLVESTAATQTEAVATRTSSLEALRISTTNLAPRARAGANTVDLTWGTAPWGYQIVGTGSMQTRQVQVGPLRKNIPFSLRCRVRMTAGSSAVPLTVDLFPDNLPETIRVVEPGEAQDLVWENISSPQDNMLLPSVTLRFFSAVPTGTTIEVTDIMFVQGRVAPLGWLPSPGESGYDDSAIRALINTEETARVDADSALATRTFNMESEIINARGGQTNLLARINQVETTFTDADSALATRTSTLESKIDTPTTGILARITTEETTRANADSALAGRTSTLESKMDTPGTGVLARITAEELTRAAADSAQAGRTDTVEARLSRSSHNILLNSTFADGNANWGMGATWLLAAGSAAVGPHAYCPIEGTHQITSDFYPANPNFTYVLSADFRALFTGGNLCGDVEWWDASAMLGWSPRIVATKGLNFAGGSRPSVVVTPPAGTTRARVRIFTEGVTGLTTNGAAVRQIQLQIGNLATGWADDAQAASIAAKVTTTSKAVADAGGLDAWWQVQAIAGSAMAGIRAKANSVGGSQIGMIADAIALFNNVLGVAQEVFVASGGNIFIRNKLTLGALGEIVLDPSLPAIIWTIGSAKFAIGKLPNNNMLLWFGPSMLPSAMTKTNATIWADTTGNAYFGGSIIAGALSNSRQGTDTTIGASCTVGPFATNGNPITIAWGYTFQRAGRQTAGSPTPANPSATIRLYRTIGSGGEVLVDTMSVTGSVMVEQNGPNDYFVQETMSGSSTFTDTVGGLDPRTYRVEVFSRTTGTRPGSPIGVTGVSQRYSILTSEN